MAITAATQHYHWQLDESGAVVVDRVGRLDRIGRAPRHPTENAVSPRCRSSSSGRPRGCRCWTRGRSRRTPRSRRAGSGPAHPHDERREAPPGAEPPTSTSRPVLRGARRRDPSRRSPSFRPGPPVHRRVEIGSRGTTSCPATNSAAKASAASRGQRFVIPDLLGCGARRQRCNLRRSRPGPN